MLKSIEASLPLSDQSHININLVNSQIHGDHGDQNTINKITVYLGYQQSPSMETMDFISSNISVLVISLNECTTPMQDEGEDKYTQMAFFLHGFSVNGITYSC